MSLAQLLRPVTGRRDTPPTGADDLVPLSDRLRVMQRVRAAAVGLVLLCAALLPAVLAPGLRGVLVGTGCYAGLVAGGDLVRRLTPHRSAAGFSVLLLLDGGYFAWAGHLSGETTSPLRYAMVLHLGAVALLASYRTALKLALWDSLLLSGIHNAVHTGALASTRADGVSETLAAQRLAVFVSVLWLVAITTSALSAVNERELRRRRRDLEGLAGLAEALERTDSPHGVAAQLLGAARDVLQFSRGVVLAGPGGNLSLLAGLGHQVPLDEPAPGPSAVVREAHAAHRSLLVHGLDPLADAWLSSLLPEPGDLVVVPLSAEGRPMGALVVEHPRRVGRLVAAGRIQRRVVVALERSAAYASLALRNAWLLEQVRQLAATDGLTRIANRRTFEDTLERELARAARSRAPLSLVLLDIDHFKRLNDEWGHQAGDQVLRQFAAALSSACRDFDTPARYGGEEFAVILPGCSPREAALIAERLRCAAGAGSQDVPATASAGVATYPTHASDGSGLVRAADQALYQAKDAGRARTVAASAARARVPSARGPALPRGTAPGPRREGARRTAASASASAGERAEERPAGVRRTTDAVRQQ